MFVIFRFSTNIETGYYLNGFLAICPSSITLLCTILKG